MAQLDPFVVELLGLLILSPPGLLAAVRPIVDYATEQSAMVGFPLGKIWRVGVREGRWRLEGSGIQQYTGVSSCIRTDLKTAFRRGDSTNPSI